MTTTIANSVGNKTYFIMHKARPNTPLVANNFQDSTDYKFVPDPIAPPVVYYAGTRVYTAVVGAIPSHFILDANMEILYAERADVFVHCQNLILGTKDQQHLSRARAACVDYASLNKSSPTTTTTSGVVPPPTSTGKRKRNDIYDNNYDAQTDPIGATPAAKRVDARTMAVFGDSVSYAFNPEARKIPETPFQFTGLATTTTASSSPRASPAFSSLYNTSRPQPPRTNTASLANTTTTQGNNNDEDEEEDNEVNSSKKAIVCLFAAFLLIMVVTICIVMPVYCYYCFFFDFDGVEVEVGRGAGTGAGVGAGTEGFNTSDA